ncbi:MAG TPA: hypothetical protein VG387_00560 [Rhizomicrobium sp.]|jgi:hypothetical protein|nr:hypothetical protein [Rhizomicrobium sp.]
MRTVLTALALCVLTSAAFAADGEHLRIAPYPAAVPWKKITDHHDPKMTMYEWIPADQSENDIHDILTEQDFPMQANADPAAFVRNFLAQAGGACRSARVNGPKTSIESGYPVAYAQAYCAGNGNLDVDIFVKAIGGKRALYVVQREFRRPAQPGAVAGVASFDKSQMAVLTARMTAQSTANRFLSDSVQLCSGTCPAHRP